MVKVKVNVKFALEQTTKAQRGSTGIALLIVWTRPQIVVGDQRHVPAALPPGKTQYSLYRRLGGPQGRSGRAENLVSTEIPSRTVQPVASRYTDWAIPAFRVWKCLYKRTLPDLADIINIWIDVELLLQYMLVKDFL